jgi:hypothetical protein
VFRILITVLIAVVVLVIREAFIRPLFLPVLAVLLLAWWLLSGNPVGLLTSGGGWIISLFILWAARILAVTLQAAIDAARGSPVRMN